MTLAEAIEAALRTDDGYGSDRYYAKLTIGPIEVDGSVVLDLQMGPSHYLFAADSCSNDDLIASIDVIARVVDPQ